ncbi:MAG: hypothetical protein EX254_04560 [Flavobacteriaceae bacterium]|nr:MAG: hypothetical protein EX254_04560 [Flavobacteriaceae bacterium]
MKNAINKTIKLLLLPLIVLMSFTACQDEVTDVTDPDQQETLVANSPLATSVERTTLRDGSADNIIDSGNCISVNLPVTVNVNGLEITIDSEEDLEVIEAIFDEFDDDEDILEIVFPIVIILNDYTEVTINNQEELEQFVDECSGENEDDDDIECIDFQYPITISVFDSNFDVIDTITINSDEELYHFIDELDGSVLASINFPVTMINADGTTTVVNNNDELLAAIEAADDSCDEDDDNDYNDDDNIDISADDLGFLLTECTWTVDKLEVNDQDLEEQYEGYVFTFFENGTVKAEINGNFDEGTWELIQTDAGIKLNLQMNNLTDFNNELWQLHEIHDEYGEVKIDFRQGEDRLRFEKHDCDVNPAVCPEDVVDAILAECYWRAGFNGDDNLAEYEFYFNENDDLVVQHSVNDQEIVGFWNASTNDNGATTMTFEIGQPLSDINGEWTVIECSDERVKMVMGDLYLVFERECESDSPYSCIENIDLTVAVCDDDVNDGLTEFDLTALLANCANDQLELAYFVSLADAENNVNPIEFPYTNVTNPQTLYLRASVPGTTDFEVFEVQLIVEDCSTGCTEADVDLFLMECEWFAVDFNGSDDLSIFELDFNDNSNLVITNTTNNETVNGFWATSETADGVWIELDNLNGSNIQALTGTWLVTECSETRLKLENDNNGYVVIERECN